MIVIVNYRTGGHCTLSGPAADLWRTLAATGDADPAIIGIPATAIVNQMIRRNLLTEITTARPWAPCPVTVSAASWGTIERDACLAPLPPTPRKWQVRGAVALLATLTVRETGRPSRRFARMLALLRLTARYGHPASDQQALYALHGVRHAARFLPARIACLEESVATMLTLTTAGYQASWCHGVAADPIRLHAWVEADGERVGEPASTGLFTPIMRIQSAGATQEGDSNAR
ncbi:MAG: lasso peptide biosynthesis B2 protein [Pseudonocardiaceae bacterium]